MRKIVLIFTLFLFSFSAGFAQDFSNKGKDFYLCFPSHVPNQIPQNLPILSIYITSDKASTGTVTMANGAFNATFNLTAANNFYQEIQINSATAQVLNSESNTVVKKSIRVKTNPGQPAVVVYAQQWAGARSAATLVLPVNVLGKKYYAVSANQDGSSNGAYLSKSHFQVIAVKDNTVIQVTPQFNGIKQLPFTVTLPLAGDMYQYEPNSQTVDITGSYIESLASGTGGCLPIAVFSGTGNIRMGIQGCGSTVSSYDPLWQQDYPVGSWGKNFGFIPFANYPNGNPYRVIASENNTNLFFNGTLVATLNAGDIYPNTFVTSPPGLSAPTYITADKPVSVTQYLQSNGCSGFGGSQGDPDMVILNPIEQNISDITVFSSSQQAITQRFVNVLMKTIATGSFRINGVPPATAWQPLASLPGYSYLKGEPFPGTGSYHLVADSGFNAIAYGYGANESYAYSAGTNVKDFSKQLGVSTTSGIETSAAVCTGEEFKFKVCFPSTLAIDSMDWNCNNTAVMNPNNFPLRIINPTVDSTTVINGTQVKWYSLPANYSFSAAGTYTITITNYTSGSDACGSAQENEFELTVVPPPAPYFSYSTPGCYLEPVQFTETTSQLPKPTYSWYWNFGDPASGAANISTQRNPVHTFSGPGTYTVKYAAITTTGCLSDTFPQQVIIPGLPDATMSTGNINVCLNAPQPSITLTGTGGLPPYDFTYSINGVPQPVVTSNAFGVYTINNIPTNTAGQFIYKLTDVKNSGSAVCGKTITGQEDTVFVKPYASMSLQSLPATTNQTVCVNTAIAPISYQVTNGTNGIINGTLPPGIATSFTAGVFTISGTPTVSGVYNFTVSPAGACTDPAFAALPVTINVTADATLSLQSGSATQTVCINNTVGNIVYSVGGGATGAVVTGLPPGVNYVYTPGSPNGTVTISGAPSTTVGSPFTYSIATVSTCVNPAPLSGTITVNPDATITLSSPAATTSQTVCVNNAVTNIVYAVNGTVTGVTVNNLPPGVTYTYVPGSPGTLTISGVPTAGNVYNYSVVITGPCQVPPVTGGTITVTPDAAIALQTTGTNNQTVCINTPASQIIYQVSGSVSGVTVTGLPPGMSYVYTPGSPGSVVISGSPTNTAGSPYNYTVTVAGPCLVPPPATGAITVTPDAVLTLSSAPATTDQTICVNTAIVPVTYVFSGSATGVLVTGTLPPGVNWSVTGTTLTISGIPTVISPSPVVYNYTVQTQGPCFKPSAAGKITVNPDHTLSLTGASNPPSQTVCLNTPILPVSYTFGGGATGVTVAGLPPGLVYTITGNTVTITGNPSAGGAFTVTTNGNSCKTAQLGGTITVNPLPVADFNFTTPSCDTRTITFTDNSVPNGGVITNRVWDFGDGSPLTTGNPVNHIYPAAGTYIAKIIVTNGNGCSNAVPFTKTVNITARPHADFTVPVACISDNALFTDNSTGGTGVAANYKWDFGDPASGASNIQNAVNGTHIFSAAGTFTVTHIVTSAAGCTDTTSHTVLISSAPVAGFSVANLPALCSSDSVSITNLSTIAVGSITKLEVYWDYTGAPAVFDLDNAPVLNKIYKHKYPTFQSPLTRTYTIRVQVYSGASCVAVRNIVITLNATPKVLFSTIPDVCYDAAPFLITQGTETGGVPGSFVYSGPGIVNTNGLFNPVLAGIGTHTIKYVYTSSAAGCMDSAVKTITVLDTASAKFSLQSPACEGKVVTFREESTAPAGITLTNTVWNFGDGSPVQSYAPGATVTHTYAAWGNYTVSVYNTSAAGCNSKVKQLPVYAGPVPVPAFAFGQTSVCIPNADVSFINNSTIADNTQNAFTYAWNFGDPASGTLNTSLAKTPAPHHFGGTGPYTVKLVVTSSAGCKDSINHIADFIHPQPKTVFNFNKPGVCIGDNVTMTDVTDGLDGTITQWFWKFSDGGTANTKQVYYTFPASTTYDVTLFTVNSRGCSSDTVTKQFTVYGYPTVDAGPDRVVLEGGSITIEPVVTGNGLQYLWSPSTYLNDITLKNPTANNVLTDITYTLTVTGEGGCTALPDKMFVKVLRMPKIPNTFTPNGDGINETWKIENLDTYPNCKVQVFTRTGQLVFESRGYKTPWDGRYNGKALPFDTYYYIIEPGNERQPVTGYVTIIK